jgi:hypothetical protein
VLAQWRDEVVVGQQGGGVIVALELRVRVAHRVAAAGGSDLGHVLLGEGAGIETGSRLQRGERRRIGPQRGGVVRVELAAQHTAEVTGRRLAVAEDQRDVDLAHLQLDPRLVQRPRAVHVDVRFGDGRPRPEAVERHHEREPLAGEVVGAAGADEVDPVLGDARLLHDLGEDRHEHLDLVRITAVGAERGLSG